MRVSIVMPNFNQHRFLAEAIESVVTQKDVDFELLVIDGGSVDGSVDIIRQYEQEIAFWVSEPDAGHYDAVNKGMERATGEVLAFLNSDDKLFPGALRLIVELFQKHENVDWVTSLIPACWDIRGDCFDVVRMPGFSKSAFLDGRYGGARQALWIIQQESTFWRRSLWEKAGARIESGISLAGDFELWARFYQHAELVGVNALLAGFRFRDGQRGQVDEHVYAKQCAEVLSKYRKLNQWSGNPVRDMIVRARLGSLPKLGGLARKAVGYRGRKLVREQPGVENSSWQLVDFQFL